MTKISQQNLNLIVRLEADIHYIFEDKELALMSITHASYGDGRRKNTNNERLEFLGDRVLGLLTAELLYASCPGDEGLMARSLNALVRKEACAKIARMCNLGDFLLMAPSEIKQGGRDKTSILGDACEALLAAIYLDGDYQAAKDFYIRFWEKDVERVTSINTKDPKTILQEKAYLHDGALPSYSVVERTGPDHRPLFVVEVDVPGVGSAQGTGKSKKDAERFAASHLLDSWPKT